MVHMVVPMVSVVLIGLFAGLFFAFSIAVMPGLRRAGDRAMVEAIQGVNVAILNPLFALVFMGAPVGALATVVLYGTVRARGLRPRGSRRRWPPWWRPC
jgi:uncharacterized membrane protein